MRADELIEILKELPGDTEVVIAVLEPVNPDADEISLQRYDLDLMIPEAEDGEAWLVVGEEADLDAFIDAYEGDVDADADADHAHGEDDDDEDEAEDDEKDD